eukprot:TRINITY_DN28552_c1_g1_i1.p1 TRINITY_DN28552_c1_g1~~TRINITY_DN28552_c1_g1_i1.p1  ORF type:complete len:605 (+),score=73.34 TRINITY_DN28552_c1_g1_i1:123-1937(+)
MGESTLRLPPIHQHEAKQRLAADIAAHGDSRKSMGDASPSQLLANAETQLQAGLDTFSRLMRKESRASHRIARSSLKLESREEQIKKCRQAVDDAAQIAQALRATGADVGLRRSRLELLERGTEDFLRHMLSLDVPAEAAGSFSSSPGILLCGPEAALPRKFRCDHGPDSSSSAEELSELVDHNVISSVPRTPQTTRLPRIQERTEPGPSTPQQNRRTKRHHQQHPSTKQSKADAERKVRASKSIASAAVASRANDEALQEAFESSVKAKRARVEAVFARWDKNSDGLISDKEFRSVFMKLGLSRRDCSLLLAEIDLNGDKCLDYNEFIFWLFARSEVAAAMRNQLDLEGDPHEALFLLKDRQRQLKRSDTEELLQSAVFHTLWGEYAQHPQRAEAGLLLLQCAHEWIHNLPSERNDIDQEIIKLLFFDSIPSEEVSVDSIEMVVQKQALKQFLTRISEHSRSCVEVTFHGTAPHNVQSIVQEGLRLHGSKVHGAKYGLGAYTGCHAGLAHQYTGTSSQRHMFAVLANIGRVEKGITDQHHHHTTSDDQWNPTQYCFCEEDRLLVTHLITYRVTGSGATFRAQLRKAHERAGERVLKAGYIPRD